MSKENVPTLKVEVQRLLDAGFIKEVTYPELLANVVMVRKKIKKWRIGTDFTDLNMMRFGTMGTTSPGLDRKEQGGLP
jgi:hypothetical protein